jgi:medium-chain acyl-CoA synthetase
VYIETIEMDNYEQFFAEFRWNTPEFFNFGNVIDEFASDPNRVALLWEDQEGNRARLTFADLMEQSNRIANVLKQLGIGTGDPILLVLPRIPLWQAAYIGALKVGAIVVPCTAMLREKDLVYRANHSRAKAIIASVDSATMVRDLRNECPTLGIYLIAGSARSGWKSLPEEMQKVAPKFQVAKTRASDPAICYYTSGTTKEPKAVLHSHSYIYSHKFTGLNWLDLKPNDVHWTTSDTGWAKAAYGVIFGPWMNGATVFMYNGRFEPVKEMELLERYGITT